MDIAVQRLNNPGLALILQKVDSATLAMYKSVSSNIAIGFPNADSLNRDLSREYPYPNFEYSWVLKCSSFESLFRPFLNRLVDH